MIKQFNSIRFQSIRSHLYGVFLINVILLAGLLSIYVWIDPAWLSLGAIGLFWGMSVVIGGIVSLYVGFSSIDNLRERIDSLSVLITQYANGNYESRVYFTEKDELTRFGNELNDLGEKLKSQVKSLRRMADEKSELARTAHTSAVIEERQRLARDLHDAISQQLFALSMMSEAALKQIDTNPDLAKVQMADVAKAAQQSQAEMRALLLHLRPVQLSGDSLATAVQKLVAEIKQQNNLEVTTLIASDLCLSETVEEHVFRIVQEALSNIIRHADAEEVKIEMLKKSTDLFMYISDNGVGFDPSISGRKTSYGLKTMRERTEEIGGTFTIRSKLNEGTYIAIRIPC